MYTHKYRVIWITLPIDIYNHINIHIQTLLQNINNSRADPSIRGPHQKTSWTTRGFAFNKLIFKNCLKLLLEGSLHHLSNKSVAPTFLTPFSKQRFNTPADRAKPVHSYLALCH